MARYVKCRTCEENILYSERFDKCEIVTKVSETTGKSKNFYYHKGECWEQYQKQTSFIENEMKEKDELNEMIKGIHCVKFQLPPRMWELLQDLRNGTNRYQKFFKKKYKKGIPYSVLTEAYRMSKDSIEWARLNRKFRTTEEEMRYCLKIVQGRIEDAYKKIKRTQQVEEFSKAKEHGVVSDIIEDMLDTREIKTIKKKDELDFSDILGDD